MPEISLRAPKFVKNKISRLESFQERQRISFKPPFQISRSVPMNREVPPAIRVLGPQHSEPFAHATINFLHKGTRLDAKLRLRRSCDCRWSNSSAAFDFAIE